MNNLAFSTDNQDFILGSNGHAGLSHTKTSELLRVSQSSVSRVLMSNAIFSNEEIQTITTQGFQGNAIRRLAKHFASSSHVSLETRQHCLDFLDKAAEIGAQVFIDQMAGIISNRPQPMTATEALLESVQRLVAQERELLAIQQRLDNIEQKSEEAEANLKALPPASLDAANLTTRTNISRMVREYSVSNNVSFSYVWNMVYREFRDRYHIDLKQRATNAGRNVKPLDICEQIGKMEELYASACAILK